MLIYISSALLVQCSIVKFQLPINDATAILKTAILNCLCHQQAMAKFTRYIEKVLGRNAVLDINIPALNNWKQSQSLDTCTPNSRETALKMY